MALTERLALVVSLDASKAISGLDSLGKKAEDGLRRTDSSVVKTASKLQGLGVGMLGVGGAVAAGFAVAVNASMGFDKQLSELQAVSSATGDQLGELREQALDAGAATSFSAAEAATAQTELAKAGVSLADIMGGALTGSLDLAAAGTLDLGEAASIAANAMTIFGLTGGDVTHIADVLAAGANKSTSSVQDLAMALQQSGLAAADLGIGFEESVGALALFSQNALTSSDAGTSFKTMLMRLSPQSDAAAEKMKELGIDMFDSTGEFIGLAGAAEELKVAFGPLSDEARKSAMNVIFGADAARGATVLYKAGADGVNQWTEAVDETGYASEIAGIKLDNLAGDLEALRGSLETALIQTGSEANGVLRFMVQGATDAVNAFAGLPGPVQTAGTALAGVGSAALIGAGGLIVMIPKIAQALDALTNMGPAGARAAGALGKLGKVGGAVGGVAAVTAGLIVLHGVLEDVFTESAPDIDRMGLALIDLGKDSIVAGELVDTFGEDLRGLQDDLDLLASRRGGTHLDLFEDFDEAVGRIDSMDKALANLVDSGHGNLAAEILANVQASLTAEGGEQLAERELNDYADALVRAEAQAKLTGPAVAGANEDIAGTGFSAEEATGAINDYKNALTALTNPIFAVEDAQVGLAEAQLAVAEAANEFGEGSPEWVAANGEMVRAAFGFEGALADLATGFADGTVSEQKYRDALAKLERDGLIPAGAAADIATFKFGAYKGQLDRIPGAVTTNVYVPGLAEAQARVQAFKDLLSGGVSGWYPSSGLGVSFLTTHAEAQQQPKFIGPVAPRAAGGPVDGGSTYLVGERGPELVTMGASGYVTPNNALGGTTYNISVQSLDPRSAGDLVVAAIRDHEARNGKDWRAA
jgi:TP901 family phage tail tape measure protein